MRCEPGINCSSAGHLSIRARAGFERNRPLALSRACKGPQKNHSRAETEMHIPHCIPLLILTLTTASRARKSPESVLLSSVKTLTLRKDLKTTHNRVSAVPQLNCVGGTGKGLYEIDVLRCKNSGSAYGDEDIQWTCSASLPSEFKLGSTDVICEGFKSTNDPYVLKGSCGVEYRLILTDVGEEKYGKKGKALFDDYEGKGEGGFVAILFWVIFISVVCWMIYSAFLRDVGPRLPRGNDRPGFFGGGWGGGGGNDDPPPPYDYHPPPPKPKTTSSRRAVPGAAPAPAQAQGGWRPGFWTGALGGAAAGYMAGNRGQNQQRRAQEPTFNYGGNGEGSSRWGGGGSTRSSSGSGSSSSYGSSRHESSGFGGTSRR